MLSKQQHKNNLKEFRNLLIEDFNHLTKGRSLSLKELAEQSQIPLKELNKINSGICQNWGTLHQVARFFDRKIRITFY